MDIFKYFRIKDHKKALKKIKEKIRKIEEVALIHQINWHY